MRSEEEEDDDDGGGKKQTYFANGDGAGGKSMNKYPV